MTTATPTGNANASGASASGASKTSNKPSAAAAAQAASRPRYGANPFVEETVAQIEDSTMRNPLAAVAIAAGAGFLVSKLRADKAAWHLGLFPVIASAAFGYWMKSR
jgi:hypothetical protein